MLHPAERLRGAQLDRYIRDDLYWMLHAPRQTGKTTFLLNWMREINTNSKDAISCYVSVERCQGELDVDVAMENICESICIHAERNDVPIPERSNDAGKSLLNGILTNWAKLVFPKKLVVLFDEVDVLEGVVMVSFLRQLRDGFATRGIGKFPMSIALVGMRDLKDYLTAAKDGKAVNPGSPFNIKEDSAFIGNFSREDVSRLFAQRTQETGQEITPEALNYVWEQSRGQPWIVNSLFKRATLRILEATDFSTVTLDHIIAAREQMILARETHLDSLVWRLQDSRVRAVMETLMAGSTDLKLGESEGFMLCQDLGLSVIDDGVPCIANPIYKEVLARQMTYSTQLMIQAPTYSWQHADGSLNMELLLREFQKFWRRHSEIWEPTVDYTEAFPHLLLMAYLQRITNGEGRIEREYAAGRGRMDMLVEYRDKKYILEIKLIRDYDSPLSVKKEGIKQIRFYRDKFGQSTIPCYLIIFDRRSESKKPSWKQRLKWIKESDNITVVGC
jgi:hypothetical protein